MITSWTPSPSCCTRWVQTNARISVLSTLHSYTVAATACMLCDILETGQKDVLETGQRDILETAQRVALGLPDHNYLIG